jgi:DNA cross-link repair 1A protein
MPFSFRHFHADHYQGLKKSFDWGPIVCSKITANLILSVLKVSGDYIFPVPLNQRINVEDMIQNRKKTLNHFGFFTRESSSSKGPKEELARMDGRNVWVTLVDAEHCPGAVCFLFEIEQAAAPSGNQDVKDIIVTRIFHTGDFRASQDLIQNPLLLPYHRKSEGAVLSFDYCYLDMTYRDARYRFPSQQQVLASLVTWLHRIMVAENGRKLVPFRYGIVLGRYTVGKEKVYLALLKAFPTLKIYFHQSATYQNALAILNAIELQPEFYSQQLELNRPDNAILHSVPMAWCQDAHKLEHIRQLGQFTHLISIKPTGWTFSAQSEENKSSPTMKSIKSSLLSTFYPLPPHTTLSCLGTGSSAKASGAQSKRIFCLTLPYSEHSSFDELCHFYQTIHIQSIIPTTE